MNEKTGGMENKFYCSVSMTEEEARLFYFMRRYQLIFEKMMIELHPGSIVLHFDQQGNIKKHEYHFYDSRPVDNP